VIRLECSSSHFRKRRLANETQSDTRIKLVIAQLSEPLIIWYNASMNVNKSLGATILKLRMSTAGLHNKYFITSEMEKEGMEEVNLDKDASHALARYTYQPESGVRHIERMISKRHPVSRKFAKKKYSHAHEAYSRFWRISQCWHSDELKNIWSHMRLSRL
jgi:hypothetical protein